MPGSVFNLAIIHADFSLQDARELQGSSLECILSFSEEIAVTHGSADREPWQAELLQALRMEGTEYCASAPLTWRGAGGVIEYGTWMHADPVRLEMDATGLGLRTSSSPWRARLNAIEMELRQQVAASGMQWRTTQHNTFVYSPTPLQARTLSPNHAAKATLHEALPEGPDARGLRKLMTELQMILHEKFPDPSAPNAIWFWGLGDIPLPTQGPSESSSLLPRLFADDAYARGVYLTHHSEKQIAPLPESFDGVLLDGTDALVVLRGKQSEQLEVRWFARALAALKSRRIKRIELYLNGYRAVVRYSPFKNWFTQSKSLHRMLANKS